MKPFLQVSGGFFGGPNIAVSLLNMYACRNESAIRLRGSFTKVSEQMLKVKCRRVSLVQTKKEATETYFRGSTCIKAIL
jgi:hypothetical protein